MRITYDYVKEYVESFGYKLISTEYIRSRDKLEMMCDKGHLCSINWDNFKNKRRCRTCSDLYKADKFRLNYIEVKAHIESFGCELVTNKYEKNSKDLDVKCSCGNIYKTTYQRFCSNTARYSKCKNCRDLKSKKHSYEFVKSFIESNKYTLISDVYENANEKLTVMCNKFHVYDVKFANFKTGKRCPYCNKNGRKLTLEEIKSDFKKEGYLLLDVSYKNNFQRLNFICDKGHRTTITLRDFRDGCRCNVCKRSKGERLIEKYLKENNITYIHDNPYFEDLVGLGGKPLRPDFILPDYKIWIEYDGEFHYRKMYDDDGHEKIKVHDKLKEEYAKKYNWKLIRIPYWEFDNIENILNKELI